MKPYSQDLRERVVKAIDEGRSQSEVAQLFGVSTATIKRYLRLRRETGSLAGVRQFQDTLQERLEAFRRG